MKKAHTTLDVERTGKRIKEAIKASGYKVSDIQELLNFECPQSIYRWFHGKAVPTVDALLILSKVLNMHMEDLLVEREIKEVEIPERKKSIWN